MKTFFLRGPKGLPKANRLEVRTVQPDVVLPPRQWALHHRLVNNKVITLP